MAQSSSYLHDRIDIKKAIERLDTLTWPKFDKNQSVYEYVKSIHEIFYNEFKQILNINWTFYPKEFPYSIYRARKLSSSLDSSFSFDPSLITEHSYPPPQFVNFGRCNFPKCPVFYCAK